MRWKELKEKDVPAWVKRATDRYCNRRRTRPYDETKHFVGRHYIYRIYFEMIGQAQIQRHYFRKKKGKERTKESVLKRIFHN
jgi:hypothetical protein